MRTKVFIGRSAYKPSNVSDLRPLPHLLDEGGLKACCAYNVQHICGWEESLAVMSATERKDPTLLPTEQERTLDKCQ